jgi:hypothetical protein
MTPVTPQIVYPFTEVVEPTETTEPEADLPNPPSSSFLIVVLILASFIGAGVAVWLIRDPKS